MDNQLSDKELKFIKHYKKQHWVLYFILIFVFILAAIAYYLIFHYYEPKVAHLFQNKPALEEFMIKNNTVYLKPAFTFLSLLIGFIIGSIYSQRKLSKIIDKLMSRYNEKKA